MNPTLPELYFNLAPQTQNIALDPAVIAFHRRLPGYAPTPLRAAPGLAARLGVAQVWVKDEASRLGLPAYKILGASWATYRELETRFGPFGHWKELAELRPLLPPGLTLVAATDGNHGRAVARMAGWLGLNACILVPDNMAQARIQAIEAEGATVKVIAGTYDDAVAQSATYADEQHLVISDTAWDGYERVPRWVVEGYSTILNEINDTLKQHGEAQPTLVAVQMGVGSLAAAVLGHYCTPERQTKVIGVEPIDADCVRRSLLAGQPTEAPGPHHSAMAGLNCGQVSPLAWPLLQDSLSASVAVPDALTEDAMRLLAAGGITSGESGAAGVAGLLALLTGPDAQANRQQLGVTPESVLLSISTEGATDPVNYARVVGQKPQ